MEKALTTLTPYIQGLDANTLTIISIVVSVIGVALSLIVAILGVWFAVAQYRLKRSIKISASVAFAESVDYQDSYPYQIILQNLKDKSETVFGIHIRLSNNVYITMEDLEYSPLLVQPFETVVRNYEPVSFYGCSSHKVDINQLIKENKVAVVVLTTNRGKYITKQRKHYWSPILESLHNEFVAPLQPHRITEIFPNGHEFTVPSKAKFILKYIKDEKPVVNFIYENRTRIRDNPSFLELTPESLKDKQSLNKHITSLDSLEKTHQINLDSIEITAVNEIPEQKRLNDFYTRSAKLTADSWFTVNILGKIITTYRRYEMNKKNHNLHNKNFSYNEILIIKWILIFSFGSLITFVLGSQILDLFN